MNGKDLGKKKDEIEELGLNAIKGYFKLSDDDLSKLPKHVLEHIHKKAQIGMQFEREMSVGKRAIGMNYIRVAKLYAVDQEELRQILKKSLPQYLAR